MWWSAPTFFFLLFYQKYLKKTSSVRARRKSIGHGVTIDRGYNRVFSRGRSVVDNRYCPVNKLSIKDCVSNGSKWDCCDQSEPEEEYAAEGDELGEEEVANQFEVVGFGDAQCILDGVSWGGHFVDREVEDDGD